MAVAVRRPATPNKVRVVMESPRQPAITAAPIKAGAESDNKAVRKSTAYRRDRPNQRCHPAIRKALRAY